MAKVLIDKKGNKYVWTAGDLHTSLGKVTEKDMKKSKGTVTTNIGKEFVVMDASFTDIFLQWKRNAATTHPKDIGEILVTTGINKKSKVVDAGTGSGVLAAYLANIAGSVTTYEKNTDFFKLAKKNFEKHNLKIKSKNKDITEGIAEKNLDLITLDVQDPQAVLPHAERALKSGGFLVVYLLQMTQVIKLIQQATKNRFFHEKTLEILEREWIIDSVRARPKHQMLGHTAFLVFLRKY